MSVHPCLFFDRGYLAEVSRCLAAGEPLPDSLAVLSPWENVAGQAEEAASAPCRIPLERPEGADFDLETGGYNTPDGRPPAGYTNDMLSRDCGVKLHRLALGAGLTRRPHIVAAAARLLRAIVERPDWTSPEDFEVNSSPYAHSSMRMARLLQSIGLAYDVLFDDLAEADRSLVRARLTERGLQPTCEDLGASDALRWPNGYAVLAGGLGVGALAIHRETKADVYIRRAVSCCVEFLDLHRGEGAMIEGYGYGQTGLEPIVAFLVALERAALRGPLGQPLAERITSHPVFPKVLDFIAAFSSEDGREAIGFGDCRPVGRLGYSGYLSYMSWHGSGAASWLLKQNSDSGYRSRMSFASPRAEPKAPVFRSALFRTAGFCVLRDARPGTPVLALKAGPATTEVLHNHYDQNHVVLWHRGRLLLWDPGYHRELYAFGTEGHNTLLVDGRGQDVVVEEGREETFRADHKSARERDLLWGLTGAEIVLFTSKPEADLVCGSAAHAYNKHAHRLRRFDRYAVFIRPDCFVLHDRLCAQQPRTYSLLFHGAPGSRIEPRAEGVRIVDGDAALDLSMAAPGGWTRTDRQAPEKFDRAPYVEFTLAPAPETSATTALIPTRPGEAPRPVQFLQQGRRGVVVPREGGTDLLLFGFDDPAPFVWAGLEIDLFGVQVALIRLGASGEYQSTTVLVPKNANMAPVRRAAGAGGAS